MVEPVPYVFDRLRRNMAGNPRVALANVAIADTDGTKDFFHLAEAPPGDQVWAWYHALGSFDRELLLSHVELIPDIASRVVTTPVTCLTFDSLCAQHGLSTVDVIQIDTEGYDDVVLSLIDLDRYRPQVVMFEHIHLAAGVRAGIEERLRQQGYERFSDDMDTVAVHRSSLDRHPALARRMRSARRALESKEGGMSLTEKPRSSGKLSPKRLFQHTAFRLGYKIQRLSADERAAFVQFHRPDRTAVDSVFGADAARLQDLRRRYAAVRSPAAAHSVWASRGSKEDLADIGLAGVVLTRFRAGSSYVWNYYGSSTENTEKLQYYVFAQAVKAADSAALLEVLDEDGAFGCSTFEFAGIGRVSRDLLDSVTEINFLQRHLSVLDRDEFRVLDIGAGYGRMAHRLLEANPKLDGYTCVDAVPESTFLCEFYLKHRGLLDRAEVIPFDEVDEQLNSKELRPGAQHPWLLRVHLCRHRVVVATGPAAERPPPDDPAQRGRALLVDRDRRKPARLPAAVDRAGIRGRRLGACLRRNSRRSAGRDRPDVLVRPGR